MSDGTLLRNAGHPITLADGSTATLAFTMETLVAIEEEFGSIEAMQEALGSKTTTGGPRRPQDRQKAGGGTNPQADLSRPVMGPLTRVLWLALADRDTLEYRAFLRRLDLQRLQEYASALNLAMVDAFGADAVDPQQAGA